MKISVIFCALCLLCAACGAPGGPTAAGGVSSPATAAPTLVPVAAPTTQPATVETTLPPPSVPLFCGETKISGLDFNQMLALISPEVVAFCNLDIRSLSPDQKWLAVAGHARDSESNSYNWFALFDTATGRPALWKQSPMFADLKFPVDAVWSPDSQKFASLTYGGLVVMDISGRELSSQPWMKPFHWLTDSARINAIVSGEILTVDALKGNILARLTPNPAAGRHPVSDQELDGAIWLPDGTHFITQSMDPASDPNYAPLVNVFFQVWDAASGQVVHDFKGISRPSANQLLFSSDGQWMMPAYDRAVYVIDIFNLASGERLVLPEEVNNASMHAFGWSSSEPIAVVDHLSLMAVDIRNAKVTALPVDPTAGTIWIKQVPGSDWIQGIDQTADQVIYYDIQRGTVIKTNELIPLTSLSAP